VEGVSSDFESNRQVFHFPNLESELGEIERVAKIHGGNDPHTWIAAFMEAARSAKIQKLSEETWARLENSDSFAIAPGDWEAVARHAYHGGDNPRDWLSLRNAIEHGSVVDAPIILVKASKPQLVSGNTRLMVARAMDLRPDVLFVDLPA
jgi:hypothetical protein